MDINTVCVSGKIHSIGVSPTKGLYPVVEAKLTVNVGKDKDGNAMYDDFSIRSYGKKSIHISEVSEGSYVTIQGKLKEDLRVNADNPSTMRSKIYINVDRLKTAEGRGTAE